MAETLREGVRVLADAQADWIKSLTSVKGYLRNGGTTVVAAPAKAERDDDETSGDDEEEDYEEQEYVEEKHWMDKFGEQLVPVMPMIMAYIGEKLSPPSKPAAPSEGWMDKIRNVVDWRRAAEIGAAKRAQKAAAAAAPPTTMTPTTTPQAALMRAFASAPPDVVAKVMAVRQQLAPEEQAQLMKVLACVPPDEVPAMLAEVQRTPADVLAAQMRELIAAATPAPAPAQG